MPARLSAMGARRSRAGEKAPANSPLFRLRQHDSIRPRPINLGKTIALPLKAVGPAVRRHPRVQYCIIIPLSRHCVAAAPPPSIWAEPRYFSAHVFSTTSHGSSSSSSSQAVATLPVFLCTVGQSRHHSPDHRDRPQSIVLRLHLSQQSQTQGHGQQRRGRGNGPE
jgi:hypothetical protein